MDNVLVGGTFNFRLGGRSDRDRTCYCFRRINLLLMVFRLICFVCYNLFRGALWQYLVVLDAVQRCNQLRKNREREEPPKRPFGDTNQCSDVELLEDEEEVGVFGFRNYQIYFAANKKISSKVVAFLVKITCHENVEKGYRDFG